MRRLEGEVRRKVSSAGAKWSRGDRDVHVLLRASRAATRRGRCIVGSSRTSAQADGAVERRVSSFQRPS